MFSDTDNMVVKQIYRTGLHEPVLIEEAGRLVDGHFIDERTSYITSRRRQNLQATDLRASMVVTNNETLYHLTDYK